MEHTTTPRTGEAGVATLETALTLPLLLAAIWAVISYGLVFTVDHTLSAAASDGARAAVGTTDEAAAAAAAQAAATDRVSRALGSFASDAVVGTPTIDDCAAPAGARCLTIEVTYPWGTAPIVPDLLSVVTPDQLSATSTVQLSQ